MSDQNNHTLDTDNGTQQELTVNHALTSDSFLKWLSIAQLTANLHRKHGDISATTPVC